MGGERDATKYAAIFSGDDKIYWCNMQKVFKRLSYVNEVYLDKADKLVQHYREHLEYSFSSNCLSYIEETGINPNVMIWLRQHKDKAAICRLRGTPADCVSMVMSADKIREANNNLARAGDCIKLY